MKYIDNSFESVQSSGAVWKSRWPSWAPVPNKPMVSVDIKQHWTMLTHWSQFAPKMTTWHPRTLSSTSSSSPFECFIIINSNMLKVWVGWICLTLTCLWRGPGGGGRRGRQCLTLHCHHQNCSCIKMGSSERHFNVSLIVMGAVKDKCPQTRTFEESNQGLSAYQLMLYHLAKPVHVTCWRTQFHPYINYMVRY